MHHPLDWLRGFDKIDAESNLNKKCEFLLHGHLHAPGINQIRAPGRASTIIAAGACFDKRTSFNSYNFVQLDFENGQGIIYFRLYSDKDGGFWTKDNISYSDLQDGKYIFPLSISLSNSPTKLKEALPKLDNKNALDTSIRIPQIPRPYFAHYFHLQSNFTGRIDECNALDEWLSNKKIPIMVLVAIGGMGKTSLVWLAKRALE
jgi:hypothetical protein